MTNERSKMRIVVIGGTGLIGSKTIPILRQRGHEVIAAAPSTGVNTITGEGLKEAMAGTQVVIDLANSPSWEDKAVLEFFETSTRNILTAEAAAGVKHHVALSVVGADRITDSGYMRAKVAQETLIKGGKVPYTILRATQFFEFLGAIAGPGTDTVHVPNAPMQPMAADDVAAALADVAVGSPANDMLEVAGPESLSMAAFVGKALEDLSATTTVLLAILVFRGKMLTPDASSCAGDDRYLVFETHVPLPKTKTLSRSAGEGHCYRFASALRPGNRVALVQPDQAPGTGLFAASSTRTAYAVGSAVPTVPVCPLPPNRAICVAAPAVRERPRRPRRQAHAGRPRARSRIKNENGPRHRWRTRRL